MVSHTTFINLSGLWLEATDEGRVFITIFVFVFENASAIKIMIKFSLVFLDCPSKRLCDFAWVHRRRQSSLCPKLAPNRTEVKLHQVSQRQLRSAGFSADTSLLRNEPKQNEKLRNHFNYTARQIRILSHASTNLWIYFQGPKFHSQNPFLENP